MNQLTELEYALKQVSGGYLLSNFMHPSKRERTISSQMCKDLKQIGDLKTFIKDHKNDCGAYGKLVRDLEKQIYG
jgi:hypothetical protein